MAGEKLEASREMKRKKILSLCRCISEKTFFFDRQRATNAWKIGENGKWSICQLVPPKKISNFSALYDTPKQVNI